MFTPIPFFWFYRPRFREEPKEEPRRVVDLSIDDHYKKIIKDLEKRPTLDEYNRLKALNEELLELAKKYTKEA